MGVGGNTVRVPVQSSTNGILRIDGKIPAGCQVTGLMFTCPQPVKQAKPVDVSCNNCNSFGNRLRTRIGNFCRKVVNCGAGILNGAKNLVTGTICGIGGILGGIGRAFAGIGASFNAAVSNSMMYQAPQMTCVPYLRGFSNPSRIAYPFSTLYSSCYSPLMYNNTGSFMSGMLFGSMLNNRHHCHHHVSRPLVINRHIGGCRPFGRHWGCC